MKNIKKDIRFEELPDKTFNITVEVVDHVTAAEVITNIEGLKETIATQEAQLIQSKTNFEAQTKQTTGLMAKNKEMLAKFEEIESHVRVLAKEQELKEQRMPKAAETSPATKAIVEKAPKA